MQFLKYSNRNVVADLIKEEITKASQEHGEIIWIISGGSNVEIASLIFKELDKEVVKNITIIISDERYGIVDHENSNYFQLKNSSIDFSSVNSFPILTDNNLDFETTLKRYKLVIDKLFNSTKYIIGQFGIGSDGHTLGILPDSAAVNIQDRLIYGYKAKDFERITLTFNSLQFINKIFVLAFGDDKKEALMKLHDADLPLNIEPAQIYKTLANVYIINDIIGGKL